MILISTVVWVFLAMFLAWIAPGLTLALMGLREDFKRTPIITTRDIIGVLMFSFMGWVVLIQQILEGNDKYEVFLNKVIYRGKKK